ncbi:MAG: hypothetical protein HYS13_15485 [Planctomycetia bacterium]|nr:hypothetical protein [Planctomycetia bacterium]
MVRDEPLRKILESLIEAVHLQAKELEKLVDRVEQVAGPLGYQPQFSVIASELSDLHIKVKHLQSPASAAQ